MAAGMRTGLGLQCRGAGEFQEGFLVGICWEGTRVGERWLLLFPLSSALSKDQWTHLTLHMLLPEMSHVPEGPELEHGCRTQHDLAHHPVPGLLLCPVLARAWAESWACLGLPCSTAGALGMAATHRLHVLLLSYLTHG